MKPILLTLLGLVAFAPLALADDPPTSITDLLVGNGRTTQTIGWTAPSDPENVGVVAYDLRVSTSPITAGNFASATPIATGSPQSPGTPECVARTSLPSCTTHYYAIKSQDANGNWSAISNLPSGKSRCSGTQEVGCF